jgi:hypothetical protein
MDANWAHVIESSNQNFTPSGSGAVAEAVQTALRRFVFAEQFGTLSQAITAAAGKTLLIAQTINVASDVTFPSTVTVQFMRGGKLEIEDGATVRFYSQPIAGRHQIFDIVGDDADESNWGDVAFNDSDSSPTTP